MAELDRENVIRGLEQCLNENCAECPYAHRVEEGDLNCFDVIIRDSLTMLREHAGWISVKSSLPKEHPSIFAPFYGTDRWNSAMWRNESDRVLVTIRFPDGTRTVDKGKLQDGIWKTGVSPVLPQEVTHWAVWPEPPKEEGTT